MERSASPYSRTAVYQKTNEAAINELQKMKTPTASSNKEASRTMPIDDPESSKYHQTHQINEAVSFVTRFLNVQSTTDHEIMFTRNNLLVQNLSLFEDYKAKSAYGTLNLQPEENERWMDHLRYMNKMVKREEKLVKGTSLQDMAGQRQFRGVRIMAIMDYERDEEERYRQMRASGMSILDEGMPDHNIQQIDQRTRSVSPGATHQRNLEGSSIVQKLLKKMADKNGPNDSFGTEHSILDDSRIHDKLNSHLGRSHSQKSINSQFRHHTEEENEHDRSQRVMQIDPTSQGQNSSRGGRGALMFMKPTEKKESKNSSISSQNKGFLEFPSSKPVNNSSYTAHPDFNLSKIANPNQPTKENIDQSNVDKLHLDLSAFRKKSQGGNNEFKPNYSTNDDDSERINIKLDLSQFKKKGQHATPGKGSNLLATSMTSTNRVLEQELFPTSNYNTLPWSTINHDASEESEEERIINNIKDDITKLSNKMLGNVPSPFRGKTQNQDDRSNNNMSRSLPPAQIDTSYTSNRSVQPLQGQTPNVTVYRSHTPPPMMIAGGKNNNASPSPVRANISLNIGANSTPPHVNNSTSKYFNNKYKVATPNKEVPVSKMTINPKLAGGNKKGVDYTHNYGKYKTPTGNAKK